MKIIENNSSQVAFYSVFLFSFAANNIQLRHHIMTASQFAAKTTYYAMVTDMASKTVKFINAMGYSCAMAECTMAECNGYKAKAIKKADKMKWANAAKSVGFTVVF